MKKIKTTSLPFSFKAWYIMNKNNSNSKYLYGFDYNLCGDATDYPSMYYKLISCSYKLKNHE